MEKNSTEKYSSSTNQKASSYFKEYCNQTGIHGLRYVVEARTLPERIWWIISLGVSIMLSTLMIYLIIKKYVNYPVVVTFSMQETPLSQIPFPAVTICPKSKISQDYFNVTEAIMMKNNNNQNFHGETEKMHNIASTICDFDSTEDSNEEITADDFYDFLEQSKVDILEYCEFSGMEFDCKESFTPILTDEGLCYYYNLMDETKMFHNVAYSVANYTWETTWNIEDGYTNSSDRGAYPYRTFRPGRRGGLFVFLKTLKSDIEYDCSSVERGYAITINLPSTIPEVSESCITLPLNQRVTGQITAQMIKTSDNVKAFTPETRGCYFQSERSLNFFKIYTQENCLLECKTNYTLKQCDCVAFYMPRNNDTSVCISGDTYCVEDASDVFTYYYTHKQSDIKNGDDDELIYCDCLPTCTDLIYNIEISQNDYEYKPQDKTLRDDERFSYSILILYFKNFQIETKERNELYGFSDFISNFGGLLGLFTGFSMLSFIEIIYFLTLRIWGNIKLYQNWSGQNIQ